MLLLVWTFFAPLAWSAEPLLAGSFTSSDGLVKIHCEASSCTVELNDSATPGPGSSLREVENGKEAYLFRNDDAERLYRALTLPEFQGGFGDTKELLPESTALSLRCDRYPTGLGDAFSCSIRVGVR